MTLLQKLLHHPAPPDPPKLPPDFSAGYEMGQRHFASLLFLTDLMRYKQLTMGEFLLREEKNLAEYNAATGDNKIALPTIACRVDAGDDCRVN